MFNSMMLEKNPLQSLPILEGSDLLSKKGSAEAYYHRGSYSHDRGDWEEAIRFYQQAITLNPGLSAAYNDIGTACQSQGKNHEAILWYKKAITIDPSFVEAFYNLGNAYKEQKAWEETEFYSRKAAELDPNLAEAHYNVGIAFYQQDRLEEAMACWQKAVQLKPDYVPALMNLATAFIRTQQIEEAIQTLQKALTLDPGQALPWMNLGNIRKEKGEIEEAVTCYRKALTIDPSLAEAYMNLGSLAMDQGHKDGAIVCYRKALDLNPHSVETCYNLGNAYKDNGEIETAIPFYEKAIRQRPDYHQACNNLGIILYGKGRFEESIHLFNRALESNPDLFEVLNNLGNVFKDQRKTDQAIKQYQKAIALNPEYPEGHWNLSLTLLMTGCFGEGWPEYEWRWKLKGVICREDINRPQWAGTDLKGKRILLHAEQGFGDTIQFIRYVPLVIRRGGRVVVECQPEVASLLASMEGIEETIKHGQPLPDFDVHCPLLSLPLIFQTNLSNIPIPIPYLFLDPELVRKWRGRLTSDRAKYKIGLVWAGKPTHTNDGNRSLSFDQLGPLAEVPGVSYYSLQKGEAARQAKKPLKGMCWNDVSEELYDFTETGALIQNLDLIISVDTAVAHLAGALGKPVWTLLPYSADWRWLLEREDSPWYPTMKLFRQTARKDWAGVIEKVAVELRKFLNKSI